MLKLLENHVKTLLQEQFFFSNLLFGNFFENATKKCQKCQKSDFW